MKNQVDYFKKCIKILEELKTDYPDMDISQHYSLATDCGNFLSDKELFLALQRHRGELDMNTLSNDDADKVIAETDELFREVDPEDEEWEEEQ
jgi:hypothetical protein